MNRAPAGAQDESLGPTRRFSGTTTRLSAPATRPRDRTKTRPARPRDPPSSPERLERHDHQPRDLQDKDSSRAVTRSTASSRPTAIASPCDLDHTPHEPVPPDRAVRPAPRTDFDRTIHNPAFSFHGTLSLHAWDSTCTTGETSCPIAGPPCTNGSSALCARRDASSLGETLPRPEQRLATSRSDRTQVAAITPRSRRGHSSPTAFRALGPSQAMASRLL
jgi:hypothetical protein